jgi:tetratricopeptide (TPR) repeat protein
MVGLQGIDDEDGPAAHGRVAPVVAAPNGPPPQGVVAMRAVRSAMLAAAVILATVISGIVILPTVSAAQSLKDALKLHEDADKLREQGRYAEAEPLYKRAVAIYEQALQYEALRGGFPALESREAKLVQHVLAVTLNNLAELYSTQGRYAEAEPLHKRSLAIKEKALDPNHIAVATSLNNLGKLYTKQHRYAEAEPLYKRSLAINEKALGPNDPAVATSLNNWAELYSAQSRYAEAEPMYKRSLAINEKVYGTNHPDVATALNNLAALYASQRRYAEAEPLYKRALAIDEKVLPDHPNLANDIWRDYTLARAATPTPKRCTVARGNPREGVGSESSPRRDVAERSGVTLQHTGSLPRCGTIVQAVFSNPRKGVQSRPSRRQAVPG